MQSRGAHSLWQDRAIYGSACAWRLEKEAGPVQWSNKCREDLPDSFETNITKMKKQLHV